MIKNKFNLCDAIRKYFSIQPYMEIIPWAEKYINFSNDISAQRNSLDFSLYPYQIDILKQWQDLEHIKTVTVCAPQQMGKTNLFVIGILWRMIFAPSQQMIVYPSDSLAAQTNQTKILPLMRHIPQLKAQLDKKRSYRSDRYAFSNSISYFQGAGSKILSKSVQCAVGDEVDAWPVIGKLDNVADLKKRTRSYDSSILFLVCTPSQQNAKIWKSFLKSSQGYWHLRCQNCHQLSIRSCDIHNLQFQSEYDEELKEHIVKPETIRLVCPRCKFQHTEEMKREMNIHGGYIHKLPQRKIEAPGFQLGALASQLPALSWTNIATAQLEAGKKADIQTQTTFDNSFRGLPYKRREIVKEDFEKIKDHCWTECEKPSLDNIECVFVTADTQDDRSVVMIAALDINDNVYILQAKEIEYLYLNEEDRAVIDSKRSTPIETVEDLLKKEYLKKDGVGIVPTLCIIDRQGHRSKEVQYFAKRNANVFMWTGTRMDQMRYKFSPNNSKMVLGAARQYQAITIYYLYSQKKRRNDYLFFSPHLEDEVYKQILAVKPDNTKKFGDAPENWEAQGQHDFFDTLKYVYFCKEFMIDNLSKSRFRFSQAPSIKKKWEKQEARQKQKMLQKSETAKWFDL